VLSLVGQFPEIRVVEGESLEFVLVDGSDELRVDRGQDGLFLRELGVEVQHVLLVFLKEQINFVIFYE